ncbi:hypothetical protein Bca52824_009880 [Brassica carinata]|uniref:Uncharacterized protein n=1 Tax=Brassica carinata TaxID=52824 RepID=A0A8X7WD52_BRACI|nr:hypothetical protein Bca52824_009880 [Brassica carinata]
MVDGRLCLRRCTHSMRVSGRLSVSASYDLSVVDDGSGWIPVSDCDLVLFAALLQEETLTIRGYSSVKKVMG